MKLDFEKAYDTVDWICLLAMLRVRCFGDKRIAWIKRWLSSAKTQIIVNGIVGRMIGNRRGLRQGYPLSPLMYVLVVDGLHVYLRR